MRALTVRQPWAWAIVHGGKTVENRSRNIAGNYRGPIAIHAGLADAEPPIINRTGPWGYNPDDLIRGAIIGVANLWAVHEPRPGCCANRGAPPFGDPWAMADHWHLCLSNPRPLAAPIPYRGRLGLWTLPDHVAAAVGGGS